MTVLASGLETYPIGTQGWSEIESDNISLTDEKLGSLFSSAELIGSISQADVVAAAAQAIIDNTGATGLTNTVVKVNNSVAFSDLTGGTSGASLLPSVNTATTNNNFATIATRVLQIMADLTAANKNFAELVDEHNKLLTDYNTLRTAHNALLYKLRRSTGNGVLNG